MKASINFSCAVNVLFPQRRIFGVVFVRYFAHNLFQNILKCNQSRDTTVFVDDDGHVYLFLSHGFQQVADPLRFRSIKGFSRDIRNCPCVGVIVGFDGVSQQIPSVKNSDDIVDAVANHGYSRETVVQHLFQ